MEGQESGYVPLCLLFHYTYHKFYPLRLPIYRMKITKDGKHNLIKEDREGDSALDDNVALTFR